MIKQTYEEMHRHFDTHYQEPEKKLSGEDMVMAFCVALALAFIFCGVCIRNRKQSKTYQTNC